MNEDKFSFLLDSLRKTWDTIDYNTGNYLIKKNRMMYRLRTGMK